MPTALITGITGQDGSYLAELLLAKGYSVHGLIRRASDFHTQRIDHLYRDPHQDDGRFRLHYGDLLDGAVLRRLLEDVKPQEVYNLAAQSHVRVSFDMPVFSVETIVLGTLYLLEAIRDVDPKGIRFYQASSSEMFGSAPPPQSEKTPFHPRSPYGCAKVFAHHQTVNYREAYGLYAASGILFNHECVASGTPVIVRRDGLIDILPIDEVVPHRSHPRHGTRYTTTPGKPFEVWDRDGWTTVTCMTATWKAEGRSLVRVATRGAVFATTEEHVVFRDDGSEISAGQVEVGDRLALIPNPEPESAIQITESEAWLLGALAGDGYVSPEGHVRITGNDPAILEEAERAWRATTGGGSRRWEGTSGFSAAPVAAVDFTRGRAFGRYLRPQLYTEAGEKRVPARVLNGTLEAQLAFLAGYNVTDGLRAGHGKYEFKSFKTSSACLAAGLWWLARTVLRQRAILCLEDRRGQTYYQINLNVPDDQRCGMKGIGLRRPLHEVIRVDRTSAEGWVFDLATESGTFHAGVGDGWIHNSPRRGETFVTRKVTRAATRIKMGLQETLFLGNLDAKRDWGFAGDFVDAMWRMLQQKTPDDYVIATGESHSVREWVDAVFGRLGLDPKKHVKFDPRYVRPSEVDVLQGDASKARKALGWKPKVGFAELVATMTDADLALAKKERLLKDHGHADPASAEARR